MLPQHHKHEGAATWGHQHVLLFQICCHSSFMCSLWREWAVNGGERISRVWNTTAPAPCNSDKWISLHNCSKVVDKISTFIASRLLLKVMYEVEGNRNILNQYVVTSIQFLSFSCMSDTEITHKAEKEGLRWLFTLSFLHRIAKKCTPFCPFFIDRLFVLHLLDNGKVIHGLWLFKTNCISAIMSFLFRYLPNTFIFCKRAAKIIQKTHQESISCP